MPYVSATHLARFCPAFLKMHSQFAVQIENLETALGSLIHHALAKCLDGADVDDAVISAITEAPRNDIQRRVAEDKAMQDIIRFYTERGCGYIHARGLHEKENLAIEMPVVVSWDIAGDTVKIAGRLDAFDPEENVIYDWKTGSYLAEEHINQMKIYSVLLTESGVSEPPYLIRLVYIGVSYPFVDEVVFVVDEKDTDETRAKMWRTLSLYLTHEDPPMAPSDACAFCPYKFRCSVAKVMSSGGRKEEQAYRSLSLQEVSPVSAGEKEKMWRRLSVAYHDIGLYFLQKSSEASKRANGEKVEKHIPAINTYFPMDYILSRLARIPLEDLRDVVADIFINMGAIKGKILAKYFTIGENASRYFSD